MLLPEFDAEVSSFETVLSFHECGIVLGADFKLVAASRALAKRFVYFPVRHNFLHSADFNIF
jgi:hypothetical protein